MDQETLKNNNFPTIYDYEDTAALGTMALVDEIQGRYTFYIEDTEVKGTLTLFIQTATESYEGIFSLE